MIGSIGYYLSSRTGRFVVRVDGTSEDEALDILAKATLKELCQQFPSDCNGQTEAQLTKAIKRVLPDLVNPLKPDQRESSTETTPMTQSKSRSSNIGVHRDLGLQTTHRQFINRKHRRFA
jgi:hypothetical protein